MEGKTLTAVNLSWLLAQTDGVKALLIDGDLRNPCAAEYLGLDAPTGLSEVLGGEVSLEEAIVRLEPAGLHILPGGSARDDVAEVLSVAALPRGLEGGAANVRLRHHRRAAARIFTTPRCSEPRRRRAHRRGAPRQDALRGVGAAAGAAPARAPARRLLNGSDEQLNEQNYYYRRYSSARRGEGGEE